METLKAKARYSNTKLTSNNAKNIQEWIKKKIPRKSDDGVGAMTEL
jgi:hypothetical protein